MPLALIPYVAIQVAIGWLQGVSQQAYQSILPPLADIIAAVGFISLYRVAIDRIELRLATELPIHPGLPFVRGFFIGAALLALTQAIALMTGVAQITEFAGTDHVLSTFCAALFAAVAEEIIFRGIVFRLVWEAAGLPAAVIVSALFFGGVHMLNPGATLLGACSIAVEAGVMLGLAYALTRELWLAIGLHCGWNFFEGGVFGSAVSSTKAQGLLSVRSNGSPLLTGGSFGLEASMQAILLCTATSLLFGYLIRQRVRS